MAVGRARDDDAIDGRVREDRFGLNELRSGFNGQRVAPGTRDRVDNGDEIRLRVACDVASVHAADTSGTEQCDAQAAAEMLAWAATGPPLVQIYVSIDRLL